MKLLLGLVAVAALAGAIPAGAQTYQFQLTGNRDTATFSLNTTSAVQQMSSDGTPYYNFANIPGTFLGDGSSTDAANPGGGPIATGDVQFYSATYGGGVEVNDSTNGYGLFSLLGQQLYSTTGGTLDFTPGTYHFSDDYFYPATEGNPVTETLVISEVSAAPEPGAWALMLLGVGMCGWMLSSRKRLLINDKAKLDTVG